MHIIYTLPSVNFQRRIQWWQTTPSGSKNDVVTALDWSTTLSYEFEFKGRSGKSCWHSSSSDIEKSDRTHNETLKIPPREEFTRDLISIKSPDENVLTMMASALSVTRDGAFEQYPHWLCIVCKNRKDTKCSHGAWHELYYLIDIIVYCISMYRVM